MILVLIVVSLIIIGGFYFGKRRNLSIILDFVKILEETIKPEDKEYTWIGGVAGFKASYRKKGFKKIEITFTLLPRQSILFLPFSYLFFKGDRIFLIIEPLHGFKEEWHLIKGKIPQDIKRKKWELVKKIKSFTFLGKNFPKELLKFIQYKGIKHIAKSNNMLYAFVLRNKDTPYFFTSLFTNLI